MKRFKPALLAVAATLLASTLAMPADAAEVEIKMLNKGEKGMMVFEPDLVKVQPGDTINFVAADPGHNAETIKGMVPEGGETFKSDIGKDFSVTIDEEGLYGIKCTPHFAMGMVALVVVGEPTNLEEAKEAKWPGKAKQRFAELFEELEAQ